MSVKRILIVDDSETVRRMVRRTLSEAAAHFEVCGEAANGNEAIAQYKSLKPDLVILDINMPEKNGLEAIQEIRAADPNAAVIMLTSEGKAQALQAVSLGARDFLEKPATSEGILEKVRSVMGVS